MLSTGCLQIRTRKINISQMVGVAEWASGLSSREDKSRSCIQPYLEPASRFRGKDNKGNTTTIFVAVRNLSISPPPLRLKNYLTSTFSWSKYDRRDVTYILRKPIEMEEPSSQTKFLQRDRYCIKKRRRINFVYISGYGVSKIPE